MRTNSFTKLKRSLALVLTFCMVMSGMSLTSFAADDAKPAGSGWQIMDSGNFGAGSKAVDTTKTDAPVTTYSKTSEEDSKVIVSKEISATDTENVFDITLTVKTSEEIIGEVVSPNTATVLVIDTSNSMTTNKDKIDATKTRLVAAQAAANAFLQQLHDDAQTDGGHRWVKIIGYNYDITVMGGDTWRDVATDEGLGSAKNDVDTLKTNSGTNLHEALLKGDELLDAIENNSGESTMFGKIDSYFLVAMTDGQANAYKNMRDRYTSDNRMLKTVYDKTLAAGTCVRKDEKGNIKNNRYVYGIIYDAASTEIYHSGSGNNIVSYTVEDLFKGFTNQYFAAGANVSIATSFGNVASAMSILTKAWHVTDPMGDRISFVEKLAKNGAVAGESVAKCSANTLDWNLLADTCDSIPTENDKFYTYTLKYRVELDTESEGFIEEENGSYHYYPTNGYTYLQYVFMDEEGFFYDEDHNKLADQANPTFYEIAFTVPGVKGKIPEYTFKVEHYVKDDAGNYPQNPTTTEADGTYDRWTEFAAATYKDSYLAKLGANYQIDSYRFIEGTETNAKEKIELVEDSVLKIYYSRVPVTVTVNKFLRNDTIDAAGTRTSTAYTGLGSEKYTVGKGSSFTVPTDFLESYALVDTEKELSALTAEKNLISDSTTIETVNGGEVINLYYFTELNQAAVEVYRTFEEWGYKFNENTKKFDTEMTCLKRWTEESPIDSAAEIEFPGNGYTYTIPAEAENATEYEYVNGSALLDQNKVSDANNQVIVKPDTNKTYRVDVTYKKSADNRGSLYTVQVKHNYTYNEYKIINGALSKEPEVTEYKDIQNAQVDIVKGYKEEVATLKEQPVYDGVTYTPTAQNAENGVEDGGVTYTFGEGAVYNLYYTKDVYPETTGATVISEFYTLTPIINTTTGAITYDEHLDKKKTDIYPEKNADYVLYEGQKFIGPEPTHTEYSIVDEANNNVIEALDIDPSKNVIVLKYYKDSDPDLETAQAKIIHNYYSRFTAVINGKVTTTDYAPDASEQYSSGYGKVGKEYTGFDFIREHGEHKYTEGNPNQNLTAIYGGETVVVDYYREYKNLEPIRINVIHNYYTRHMSVKEVNGVLTAGYFEDGIELDGSSEEFVLLQDGKEVTDLYKNMVVDIKLEKTYGGQAYELEANTPYLDIRVTEGGKTYILNYFKGDELGKVQPTVTHTYYDINYDYVEGVEQEPKTVENKDLASTVTGNKDYVGLTYDAATSSMGYKLVKCVVNGEEVALDTLKDGKYVLTLAADKANKVEYTYEKINNKLEAASIVVQHYYTTIDDYTGTVTGYVPGEDYTPLRYETKSYATMSFTASHNHLDGEFPDEPTSDREQTVVLVPGDNGVINLYYVRHFSSRAKVEAVENHSYFIYDRYTGVTTEVEDLNWSKTASDLWEGEEFSAAPDTKNGEYKMETAEEALTIVLLSDSSLNVVNVKYVKTIDTTPERKPEPETPAEPENPQTPEEPEEPETIEEPDVPLADVPEFIDDQEVPLAGAPEEFEELPEDEVPLAAVPETSDHAIFWLVLSIMAALGLAVLTIEEKKARKF